MTRKRSISKKVAMLEPKEIKLLKRLKGDVKSLGFRGQLVGVFGAFDTWPYMDFAAREIALTGDISLTSLYWYTPTKVLIKEKTIYFL